MLQKQKIASEQLQDSNNIKKRHHETETEKISKQHKKKHTQAIPFRLFIPIGFGSHASAPLFLKSAITNGMVAEIEMVKREGQVF